MQGNTVAVQVVHDRVLEELALFEQGVVVRFGQEVVMNALLLALTAWSGGGRYAMRNRKTVVLEALNEA